MASISRYDFAAFLPCSRALVLARSARRACSSSSLVAGRTSGSSARRTTGSSTATSPDSATAVSGALSPDSATAGSGALSAPSWAGESPAAGICAAVSMPAERIEPDLRIALEPGLRAIRAACSLAYASRVSFSFFFLAAGGSSDASDAARGWLPAPPVLFFRKDLPLGDLCSSGVISVAVVVVGVSIPIGPLRSDDAIETSVKSSLASGLSGSESWNQSRID